ncbi:MAG TPA: Fmu (Sun) domain-containing protein [Chitinophagaceae bacterium]
MSRYYSYLNTAQEILRRYKSEEPFASFLKKFFSLNKKYGSKDRKQISHLCYCYFRIGKLNTSLPDEERILTGLFLCSDNSNEILEQLKPEWNEKVTTPVAEKLSLLHLDTIQDIFPFADELSDGIEKESFILSHIIQPDLFIRLRPGKEDIVKQKLKEAGIDFTIVSDTCIALPNASKIDSIIELNKEAVVQDLSSQRIAEFIPFPSSNNRSKISAWDCCAASGGKSILLHDLYPGIELTVSDVRESILINLKKRFSEAGIYKYKSTVADLTISGFRLPASDFGLIIADVPCSGSGTWGRTPEQLFYFKKEKINEYASLQQKIVSNVIPHVKAGGYFLYITCSVFKKENEEAVEFIKQNFGFSLLKMEMLKGYDKKADTMFAALLQRPL